MEAEQSALRMVQWVCLNGEIVQWMTVRRLGEKMKGSQDW